MISNIIKLTHYITQSYTPATLTSIPTNVNRKMNPIAASSTRTANTDNAACDTEKRLLKTQVSEDFT